MVASSYPMLLLTTVKTPYTRAVLVGCSIFVSFLLVELLLRIFISRLMPIPDWQTEARFTPDPYLVYRLKPGLVSSRTTKEYIETVSMNGQGVRSVRETAIPKPEGTYRILLAGDSFTFGHGLKDDDTIASRMDHLINNLLQHAPTDVLNRGTPGYSPDQSYRMLIEDIPKFHPDIIFWNLIQGNMDESIRPGRNYRAVLSTLAKDGSLVSLDAKDNWLYIRNNLLIRTPRWVRKLRLFDVSLSALSRLSVFTSIPDTTDEGKRAWAKHKLIKQAEDIHNTCGKMDCTLIVTWMPSAWKSQYPNAIPFPEKDLNELGIQTLNIEKSLGVRPENYFLFDGHPNPLGAKAIAEVMAERALDVIATPSVSLR